MLLSGTIPISIQVMSLTDPETVELLGKTNKFLESMFSDYGGSLEQDLQPISENIYRKIMSKEHTFPLLEAAQIASESFECLAGQHAMFCAQYELVKDLKTKLISSQAKVIELQDKLLDSKTEQFTTVTETVEKSIESSLKTYASAVGEQNAGSQISAPELRTAVQEVVQTEERSHNLILFGLPEAGGECEDTEKLVGDVLLELGEKPHVVAERLGRITVDTVPAKNTRSAVKRRPRPVKICLTSPALARKILSRARDLRESQRFSGVFICPDRSSDQRVKQRNLVLELKKRKEGDPGKNNRHYIRGGTVHTEKR